MSVPAIAARGLSKSFGALAVAQSIDFTLERGARHALIGPNGAGKTTFVNLLTGRLQADAGTIELAGVDVTRESQAARVKRGLARTFQINQLFRGLSVLENVTLAVSENAGKAGDMFRAAGSKREIVARAFALLEDLGLADDALTPVRALAYGRQRLVEIAIALGLEPKVLLLDEPAAGVPSTESRVILDVIAGLPADIAVLIIEHDMDLVFRFAREITVLVQGAVLTRGTPQAIRSDPRVREVYLGERHG
ncbi:MAG: ABC transporter ATP-binding protein [Alphaproteobacteria bacterium]|nr:ABC transporter ATP-binding protein [Alphaproteobacteria bacterium]